MLQLSRAKPGNPASFLYVTAQDQDFMGMKICSKIGYDATSVGVHVFSKMLITLNIKMSLVKSRV